MSRDRTARYRLASGGHLPMGGGGPGPGSPTGERVSDDLRTGSGQRTGQSRRTGLDQASRSIGRRRALPTGRAVAGGFFVAVAAILVFGAWLGTDRSNGRVWTIARHDLAVGTRLDAGDLTTATMQLPGATASAAFGDPGRLVGRTLASPLRTGELVQASALVAVGAPPPLRPVSVSVDPAGAADLSPGQLVDVLVTEGSDASSPTRVVVRGAQVLDTAVASSGLLDSQNGAAVTLGVATLDEVEAIVNASHTGTVTVVVGEPSDGQGPGPATAPPPATEGEGG